MPTPKASLETAKARLNRTRQFVSGDIWRTRLTDLPTLKRIPIRLLRILILSVRGFREDAGMLRASSLPFYTLLSIVPVAAMAFGIAKGFGLQAALERSLREQLAGQQEVLDQVIAFAQSLLENTRGGVVAGGGGVALMVMLSCSSPEARFRVSAI